MKCPECGKEIKGVSCSYCNYDTSKYQEEVKIDKNLLKKFNNKKMVFIFGLLLSIIFSILATFSMWFWGVSFLIILCVIVYFFKVLKKDSFFSKKNFYWFFFLLICTFCLVQSPLVSFVNRQIKMYNASSKYSEMLDINLPDEKASDYKYYRNSETGLKAELFVFDLTDEQLEKLYDSAYFRTIKPSSSGSYLTYINNVGYKFDEKYEENNKYYSLYDTLEEKYQNDASISIFNFVIVIVRNDNKVIVCDMLKAKQIIGEE